MVARMKTTVDLPDELFRQVRLYSRQSGVTMRELVIEGLRTELTRRQSTRPRAEFAFAAADGQGLRAGLEPGEAIAVSYGMPAS